MADAALTYTLKYPSKSNPWLVLKAESVDEMKRLMADVFDQPYEEVEDMPLHELILDIDEQISRKGKDEEEEDERNRKGKTVTPPKAKGNKEDMPVVDTDEQILQWINEATSVDDLNSIWEHKHTQFTAKHNAAIAKRHEELSPTKGEK